MRRAGGPPSPQIVRPTIGRLPDHWARILATMMSAWRPGHFFALFLLVYITADFMDPFTPGVFFFDKDTFFLDGAVQFKGSTPIAAPPPSLIPSGNPPVQSDAENVVVKVRTAALCRPQLVSWTKQKRDDSASFGSTSPPDSTPAPIAS